MEINRDNYESFFLTCLDGELSPADKESVEKFLSENTDLQKEFSLLKSMRLVPDDLYFDNKQMLLRTEEKRRVLPVYWLRIAAVLMLGIGGVWLLSGNLKIRKGEKLGIVKNEEVRKIEELKMESNEKGETVAGNGKNLKIGEFEKLKMERNKKGESIAGSGKNLKIREFEKEETETVESKEVIADIQKTTINMQPETTLQNPVIDTRGMTTPEVKMSPLVAVSATVPENNSRATSAVLQTADPSEDVSISVLSVSAKNKPVTGFFKKLLNTGSDKNGRTVNVSVLKISY